MRIFKPFNNRLSVLQVTVFLWLFLIVVVGLYRVDNPQSWPSDSFLLQFASSFPNIFGVLAALIMLPIYALTPLEHLLGLVGLDSFLSIYYDCLAALSVLYLYWIAGGAASFFEKYRERSL